MNPIDQHIGKQIRMYREQKKLSQRQLAEALKTTQDRVCNYEWAKARVPASRLYQISKILKVPIASFYRGVRVADAEGAER